MSTTLTCSVDAEMQSSNPTTNYGTETTLQVGEYKSAVGDYYRSLLKFDLTSLAGKTVGTATLFLKDTGANYSDNERTMRAYRVLRAWTEAGVTWNTYNGSNAWGTAGCANTSSDREATDIGTITMPATETTNWYSFVLTPSAVQGWIDGTLTNNGLLLQMDTETDDEHAFASSDSAGNEPYLVITEASSGFFALL